MEEGIVLLPFMTSLPTQGQLFFTLLYFTLKRLWSTSLQVFWYLHDTLFSVRIIPVLYDGFSWLCSFEMQLQQLYLFSFCHSISSPRLLTWTLHMRWPISEVYLCLYHKPSLSVHFYEGKNDGIKNFGTLFRRILSRFCFLTFGVWSNATKIKSLR